MWNAKSGEGKRKKGITAVYGRAARGDTGVRREEEIKKRPME